MWFNFALVYTIRRV